MEQEEGSRKKGAGRREQEEGNRKKGAGRREQAEGKRLKDTQSSSTLRGVFPAFPTAYRRIPPVMAHHHASLLRYHHRELLTQESSKALLSGRKRQICGIVTQSHASGPRLAGGAQRNGSRTG
ncbi:hypothetical protein NHX12_007861 [Muraenolepis orangiensis]|uniref:Uncharacterized protein n=1 Tax=Muraenolepis orangiensis TaxID=630683 RepID=A0A9Q0IBP3_9TELE|nr:hypothetical protein NHX12_007861 [Muraenolepis orangiensis]